MKTAERFIHTLRPGFVVWVVALTTALLFSFFLMFHTFSYDASRHEMRIAAKAWSDFGAHIPLIRSFSQGQNGIRLVTLTPIESPLYPGEPIRYHFGFYALVGILEKMGLRIDWALNIPSAAGFFLLLLFIYTVSYRLFKNASLSALSVLFFLFNGSLAFREFFRTHPFAWATLTDMVRNNKFIVFGPWDTSGITAFWSLNIYTNQRHLALSYALILIILYVITGTNLKRKDGILTGLLTVALMFINFPAAVIAGLFCGWMFLVEPRVRKELLMALLFILPGIFLLSRLAHVASGVAWQPGYLIDQALTIHTFMRFWWDNLGLHSVLIPLGLLLTPKPIRRRLAPPLLLLFVLPNLFRFSPDMINNHKFFNFFLIIGNMFSAYAIIRIAQGKKMKLVRILCAAGLMFFATLSGIIDFFPIINDTKGNVSDFSTNPDSRFFHESVRPDDVVANSTWFYHPASVAGRAIYSGYTYFTWSYGYDQVLRESKLRAIFEAADKPSLCRQTANERVAYIELNPHPEQYLRPNWELWDSMTPLYVNPNTGLRIYKTADICTI